MTILLTADLHLDDHPSNDYRWSIFDHLAKWIKNYQGNGIPEIYILGDICDQKDRHSAALVNRLIAEIKALIDMNASIWITMGNHDKPLNGAPFWSFIDYLKPGKDIQSGASFITQPHAKDNLLLLPYNPSQEWKGIDFKLYKSAFIHQTVTGALGNNGIVLENPRMARLPKALKVYSGDIHTPQVVGNVTYVGAPYPVAFGDSYPTRMLELNEAYEIKREIKLPSIQKLMIRIRHPDELALIKVKKWDQARVICALPLSDVEQWPAMQDAIVKWSHQNVVQLFSIEPKIEGTVLATSSDDTPEMHENDPEYILRLFADAESIDDRMFDAGIALLKEVM